MRFSLLTRVTLSFARAAQWAVPYVPPELMNPSPRVAIPSCIDVNHAQLGQLMAFTTVTEDIALKIVRLRPFISYDDLERRLPISRVEKYRLRQELPGKLCFHPGSI